MSKFKVGDKVRVMQFTPPGRESYECYFDKDMDKYLGTEQVISAIGDDDYEQRYYLGCTREWVFTESWLTLVEPTVGDSSIKPSFNYKFAYRKLKLHTQCIQEMMENSDQPAKHFSQFLEKGLKAAVEMGKMASTIENWEDGE